MGVHHGPLSAFLPSWSSWLRRPLGPRYSGLCFQLRAGEQQKVWAEGGRYDGDVGRLLEAEGGGRPGDAAAAAAVSACGLSLDVELLVELTAAQPTAAKAERGRVASAAAATAICTPAPVIFV